MTGAVSARISGDRLHLQHGPIDLIIGADGDREAAFAAATRRFASILDELVAELPLLRSGEAQRHRPRGAVARRMVAAVSPFADRTFITPMAAVAGSVADEVLATMTSAARPKRAYVNNGGDIALHLAEGSSFDLAMAGPGGGDLGRISVDNRKDIRGVATSGRLGRSLSLGIADSVTVLARTAASADAAATLIANAVDIPGHPAIRRRPAMDIDDYSDLGRMEAVVHCDTLTNKDRARALASGLARAEAYRTRGLIEQAALFLQGDAVTTQGGAALINRRVPEHA